jgi:hypothetical protein
MSYRRFTDSRGTSWRVWDVVPSPLDRRLAVRRNQVARPYSPERRVLGERRVDMRRSRLFFPPEEKSWLCFESAETRCRVRPVPPDWMAWPDAELEALCERAERQTHEHQLG